MNKRGIVEIIYGINEVALNYILLFLVGLASGLWVGYILGKGCMQC